MSGGPLVDRDGALIGIVVKDEMSAEGRAVSWRTIVEVLRMNGIPVNLLEARGYRMRVFTTRLFISAYPRAGVNSDGQRLQRGWRAELTYRISPNAEVVAGLNRISFAAAPYRDQDADWDEAYAHLYGFSGFRLTTPVKWWSIGHRLPDVASVGFDILLPFNHESGVVSLVPSDSVNLQRGVPVYVRSRVTSQVGIGFAYRASYRIALSEGTAVVIAPSLYMVNFEHLNSSPARGFLEVGGEVRLGR